MHTTLPTTNTTTTTTTTNPVIKVGHKRHTVLVAALAVCSALAVTLTIAVTAATTTDESGHLAVRAGAATPWATPQHGPGSNSLSMTDTPHTATPWTTPQHGPGSNSLSMTDPRG